MTRRFFGLGPDTQETDETNYTDEVTFASLGIELALPRAGDNWILTAALGGELNIIRCSIKQKRQVR